MNMALKVAIVESHRTQRELALATGIGEVRLSAIIRGRADASSDERRALAHELARSIADLFPEVAA